MSTSTPSETLSTYGDHRDVVGILASNCVLCRRRLTDASSVQNGIGPICSTKYYSDAHVPTATQILRATGSLVEAALPDDIEDGILQQIDKLDGRKACNILVYYASAHYEERDTVFKVAAIVRDFGYTELADKLEEDRTLVTLRYGDEKGTKSIIVGVTNSNTSWRFRKDALKVKGVDTLAQKGRKNYYSFPADEKTRLLVECIVGYHFGSHLATVEEGFLGKDRTGITHIPRRSWADLEAFRRPKTAGKTSVAATTAGQGGAVRIVDPGTGRIEFWSPYNVVWLNDMKDTVSYRNRRWTGSCWTFERSQTDAVKRLAQTHYGVAL